MIPRKTPHLTFNTQVFNYACQVKSFYSLTSYGNRRTNHAKCKQEDVLNRSALNKQEEKLKMKRGKERWRGEKIKNGTRRRSHNLGPVALGTSPRNSQEY